MAFDLKTAKPVNSGFDLSTAKPFNESEPVKPKGLSGAGKFLPTFISGQTPNVGERTIFGDVFERPGASSREAIRSNPALLMAGPLAGLVGSSGVAGKQAQEASIRGANIPERSETFQDQFIRQAQNAGGPSKRVGVNFLKGLIPSAAGLATDIATNPADVLLTMVGLKPGKDIVKSHKSLAQIKALDKEVDGTIIQAIKPAFTGRKNASQISKFKQQSRSAVESIYENRDNLKLIDRNGDVVTKLPESVDEFSQAIGQTKNSIFKQYDDLLKGTNSQGRFVNLENMSGELDSVINNKVLQIKDPNIIDYAVKLKDRLKEHGKLTLSEADELIKSFNEDLKLFYRNPTPETASRSMVDALISNKLRSQLDDVVAEISKIPRGEFQSLKNRYGALRSIEEDVARRAFSQAKANSRSLIDYTDVFSGSQVVQGILTGRPDRVLTGGAQFGIKNFIKAINNPDKQIRNMFSKINKIKNQTNRLTNLFPLTSTLPASQRALNNGQN